MAFTMEYRVSSNRAETCAFTFQRTYDTPEAYMRDSDRIAETLSVASVPTGSRINHWDSDALHVTAGEIGPVTEQRFTVENTLHAFPDSIPVWGIFDWTRARWVTALVLADQSLGLPEGTVKRVQLVYPDKAVAETKARELNG